jgi:hypothetical protein
VAARSALTESSSKLISILIVAVRQVAGLAAA